MSTFYFLTSHPPRSFTAKVCSAINPTALPEKLRILSTMLPTTTGNTSTALPASFLRASASLLHYFFQSLSSFGREDPEAAGRPSPPRTPVIASTLVEKVIERAVTTDTIVTRDVLGGTCRTTPCCVDLKISKIRRRSSSLFRV